MSQVDNFVEGRDCQVRLYGSMPDGTSAPLDDPNVTYLLRYWYPHEASKEIPGDKSLAEGHVSAWVPGADFKPGEIEYEWDMADAAGARVFATTDTVKRLVRARGPST